MILKSGMKFPIRDRIYSRRIFMETIIKNIITISSILQYFWYGYLIVLIIKAFITKNKLAQIKRNMIIIKCLTSVFFGYFCFPLLTIIHFSPFPITDLSIIILTIINIIILLGYSGTPLIYLQKQVNYSWPIKARN